MEEEGVEVEAVEAVYGEECVVIQRFPPHIRLHVKPRTADDSSQQFVEAVLEFCTSLQYPAEPPHIDILESKGLDEIRQAHLLAGVREKATELSSYLMLVALCEAAVEMLSNMNHPDGDCPLCLYPLVKEDTSGDLLPFMKLMSCFHCFHSKCIIRWWNWLQEQGQANPSSSTNTSGPHCSYENRYDLCGTMKEIERNCPVCRKVFYAADVEHVLNLSKTYSSQLSCEGIESDDDDKELLQSETEKLRKLTFEGLVKSQQENNGLIEPKRHEVLQPGMFLPEPVTLPPTSTKITAELQQTRPTSDTGPSRLSNRANTSERKNFGTTKNKGRNPRIPNKQWVKKESTTTK